MNYHEEVVASTSDFQEGDMKQVTVGETDVLLAFTNNEYHAIYAYCTHYGAPLVDGALYNNRVICPWHHACFNLKGKQCEPPGLDDLPSFEVRVEGNDVYVKVPQEASDRTTPKMAEKDNSDPQVYAIVGGGAAAAYAVEAIREAGFSGRVVMISAEDEVPYDRPNASKEYLQGEAPAEWMPLRSADFYTQHGIERQHAEVSSVDTTNNKLNFVDGDHLEYDKVLLCTGGKANTLSIPGSDLSGVITLRSMGDSGRIRDRAKEVKKVVIIGSSFIGLEAAMSLQKLDCEITVVSPEKVPFANRWGEPVGELIKELHHKNGIHFELETKAQAFKGNGQIEEVVLENGKTIPAELVVVGIGVKPATDMIDGVKKAEDGGIVVNEQFQTSLDGVYAAGDIAQFPYQGQLARIEHWRVACQQGRIAGQSMAGKSETYQSVPFFWTAQQGTNFRYVGHTDDFDQIIYDGSVADQEFIAYYVKDGSVLAALSVNRDKEMAAVEHLMQYQRMPTSAEVEAGFDALALLKS